MEQDTISLMDALCNEIGKYLKNNNFLMVILSNKTLRNNKDQIISIRQNSGLTFTYNEIIWWRHFLKERWEKGIINDFLKGESTIWLKVHEAMSYNDIQFKASYMQTQTRAVWNYLSHKNVDIREIYNLLSYRRDNLYKIDLEYVGIIYDNIIKEYGNKAVMSIYLIMQEYESKLGKKLFSKMPIKWNYRERLYFLRERAIEILNSKKVPTFRNTRRKLKKIILENECIAGDYGNWKLSYDVIEVLSYKVINIQKSRHVLHLERIHSFLLQSIINEWSLNWKFVFDPRNYI